MQASVACVWLCERYYAVLSYTVIMLFISISSWFLWSFYFYYLNVASYKTVGCCYLYFEVIFCYTLSLV